MPESLNEFEAALKSLTPTEGRVDPVAAAYEAGRRSAAGQLRVWRAAAAVMVVVGAAAVMLSRSSPNVPRSASPVAIMATQPAAPAAPPQSLFMLQRAVREHGLDGLPASDLPPAQDLRAGDTL
jgi:hypothetical protein